MHSHDLLDSRLRGRRIGRVVVAGLGFLLFMAVGGNMLLAGLGVIHDSSEPQGTKSILLAVPWFAIAVACAAAAIHFEHRLRGFPSGKIALGLSAARNTMPAGGRTPRRRRYGPVSTMITAIVFLGIGIAAAGFAVSAHSEADRSNDTQANGITDTATVQSVADYQSTGRHTTTYYAKVTVTLEAPVLGHRQRGSRAPTRARLAGHPPGSAGLMRPKSNPTARMVPVCFISCRDVLPE